MALTFGGIREGRIKWRRELPPVIAVAGLAADYLSPAALWTILLPLGAVVLLLTMRKWAFAATVFLLSSWMLIPMAAGTVSAIEESRGERNIWLIDDGTIPNLDEAVAAADLAVPGVPGAIGLTVLPIGPGHLINPRWAMRDAVDTFVDLHNAMLIDRCERATALPAR
jgi:hypothetical protein